MSMAAELNRDIDIDIGGVFGALWRKRGRLIFVGMLVTALTFVALQVISPKYKSETRILIESRYLNFTRDNNGTVEKQRALLDQEGIASQVQVISSRDVARAVISNLSLAKRTEFDTALAPSGVTELLAMLGLISNPLNISPEERVLKQFFKKLKVTHVLRSRVITVEFSSKDPNLASAVPNAIADEYLKIQAQAKRGINSDEAAALEPQIKSLRNKVRSAEAQVAEYRASSDLLLGRNNAKLARSREKSLVASLNNMKAESARVGEDLVELRALEREATSQRALLQTYLRRFREATSRQGKNFLSADARIISRATIPSEHYFPKTLPIVIAAFFGSIMLASMFILAAALASSRTVGRADTSPALSMEPVTEPAHNSFMEMNPQQSTNRSNGESGAAIAAQSITMLGKARVALLSPEGEVGSEGSVLLARYLAKDGASVIVVDMTGAGSSSVAMIGPHTLPGIKDLLAGEASFADVIHNDNMSRAHIIPTGAASAEVAAMAGDRLCMVFDALEDTYDYVIIDCGAAEVASLLKISKPSTINVINAIDETNPAVIMAAEMLVHAGLRKPLIIHPTEQERQIMGTIAA
jgi:uncharacterized protein involved in exopolysaccharide biosynthesis/Mrp family chromosome partitioning ATPase